MKKTILDIATLLGLVGGLITIILSILFSGGLGGFINIPSVFVVVGGTIMATLVQVPLNDMLNLMGVIRRTLFSESTDPKEMITMLVKFAEEARRDGLLALEKHVKEINDPFIKSGLQLAIDGTEPELLRDILEKELQNMEDRHKDGQGILEAMGTFAPAFGMIGTLIGLVQMLRTMSDPSSIGPSMAVALITTLYGAVLANLIFLPMGGKLKKRSKEEISIKEMVIEGILSIQSGDNPRLVEHKLATFLPPKLRIGGEEGGTEE
ncbi:MAG: motility protein A [Calditrichia bacterium]